MVNLTDIVFRLIVVFEMSSQWKILEIVRFCFDFSWQGWRPRRRATLQRVEG